MAWKIRRWAPKVTASEFRLGRALSKAGLRFLTQVVLQGRERRHCVDFYFPPCVVVEVDGSSHNFPRQKLKDEFNTADLENAPLPFTVIRFKDWEIKKRIEGVLEAIKKVLNEENTE